MTEEFICDVFLSHSGKDKPEVRLLAERLLKPSAFNLQSLCSSSLAGRKGASSRNVATEEISCNQGRFYAHLDL